MAHIGSSKNTDSEKKDEPAVRIASNIFDVDEIRKLAYNEDDASTLYRDHAKRAIDKVDFAEHDEVDDAGARASALKILNRYDDDANVLAKRYLLTGSDVYARAWAKAAAAGNPQVLIGEEARALSL